MATSLPTPDESALSKSSNLQEPHERTSLLEFNREDNATCTSAGHATSQPHSQDTPRSVDEEAANVSESVPGKTDSKLATDIVGVISVLLLGASSALVYSPKSAMSHRGGSLFTFLGRVQVPSSQMPTSPLFLQRTARSHQNSIAWRTQAGSL